MLENSSGHLNTLLDSAVILVFFPRHAPNEFCLQALDLIFDLASQVAPCASLSSSSAQPSSYSGVVDPHQSLVPVFAVLLHIAFWTCVRTTAPDPSVCTVLGACTAPRRRGPVLRCTLRCSAALHAEEGHTQHLFVVALRRAAASYIVLRGGRAGSTSSSGPVPSVLLHTLDFKLPTTLQRPATPIRLRTRPHDVRCPTLVVCHARTSRIAHDLLGIVAELPFDARPPVQPSSVPIACPAMCTAWILRVSAYTDCSAAQQVLF
ncbi:hypothetical protein C8J57DRAFT_1728261 [Mycena rebaudengoi]|nr:hypothetical protein C8J57DRAFT_1728261 [Mycena rebaudengoi]